MNQESIFKVLIAVVIAALVALLGYSAFIVYYKVPARAQVNVGEPATLEENEALKATIDTLETMWKDRQQYAFYVDQDPLHLGRVIKDFKYAVGQGSEGEEESEIRLSATVVDENPKAIIKYNGKSYVVQTGDLIGTSYRVLKIEKKQVVLDHQGKRIVLEAKSAISSEGEGSIEDSELSNTINYDNFNY